MGAHEGRRAKLALELGFGVILFLVGISSWFAVAENYRMAEQTRTLVENAERSAYLIGHIGQQVARSRSRVQLMLAEKPDDARAHRDRVRKIGENIRAESAELEPMLTPRQREAWQRLGPLIDSYSWELDQAQRDFEEGRTDRAARRLEKPYAAVFESLESFAQLNQDESQVVLDLADRRLSKTRWVQTAVAGALFALIATIAMAVSRIVGKQQQQIGRYLDQLEAVNRDLEAFAGRVSHDLKNVLAPLPLTTRLLQRSAGDPESTRRAADKIERVTNRVFKVLDGLLAFARAGAPSLEPAETDLGEELDAVLEELAPLAEQVGAQVNVKLERRFAVECSSPLLHVVLLNLLSNAIKFLEGRERRLVQVEARAEALWCILDVEDTGPGIPHALAHRIFEPFYRRPGAGVPGSGLGLATVRRVLEAHGGKVFVESKEGIGSRFRVHLPLARSAAATWLPLARSGSPAPSR